MWSPKTKEAAVIRLWFQDDDGTYFRNCPLIMEEWRTAIETDDMRAAARLQLEWQHAWVNTIRTIELDEGDIVIKGKDDPMLLLED